MKQTYGLQLQQFWYDKNDEKYVVRYKFNLTSGSPCYVNCYTKGEVTRFEDFQFFFMDQHGRPFDLQYLGAFFDELELTAGDDILALFEKGGTE